jgi:hypothetical protein
LLLTLLIVLLGTGVHYLLLNAQILPHLYPLTLQLDGKEEARFDAHITDAITFALFSCVLYGGRPLAKTANRKGINTLLCVTAVLFFVFNMILIRSDIETEQALHDIKSGELWWTTPSNIDPTLHHIQTTEANGLLTQTEWEAFQKIYSK